MRLSAGFPCAYVPGIHRHNISVRRWSTAAGRSPSIAAGSSPSVQHTHRSAECMVTCAFRNDSQSSWFILRSDCEPTASTSLQALYVCQGKEAEWKKRIGRRTPHVRIAIARRFQLAPDSARLTSRFRSDKTIRHCFPERLRVPNLVLQFRGVPRRSGCGQSVMCRTALRSASDRPPWRGSQTVLPGIPAVVAAHVSCSTARLSNRGNGVGELPFLIPAASLTCFRIAAEVEAPCGSCPPARAEAAALTTAANLLRIAPDHYELALGTHGPGAGHIRRRLASPSSLPLSPRIVPQVRQPARQELCEL